MEERQARQAGRHSSGQCTDVYLAGSFQFRLFHQPLETVQISQYYIHVEQSTMYVNESLLLCIYLLVLIMVGLVRLYKHIYDIAWCNFFFSPCLLSAYTSDHPACIQNYVLSFSHFPSAFFPPPSCCSRFST